MDARLRISLDIGGTFTALVLRDAGAETVAICFLNVYREPRHEAAAIVRALRPGVVRRGGRDRRVRPLRHHLRERLRAALMEAYLGRLARELRGAGHCG